MKPAPTKEQIRAAQEENLADIERQLDAGLEKILVGDLALERESAWAAMTSIRKAFELDGRHDGQSRLSDGTWLAHVEIPIGQFPG